MTVEILKDLLNTYMVIGDEAEEIRDTYEIRILMSNRIEGLIPMEIDSLNGTAVCRYDVTDMKPLAGCLGGDGGEGVSVRTVYLALLDLLAVIDDYLLDPGRLLLDPEYLYICGSSGKIAAAYVPFYMKDVRESLLSLTEMLLTRIGHEDTDTVVLTCRILYELKKDGSPVEPLRSLLTGEGVIEGAEKRQVSGMHESSAAADKAAGYPVYENVRENGDSRAEPSAYVPREALGDDGVGIMQGAAGRDAEAQGVMPYAQESYGASGEMPSGSPGNAGEKRGRKPREKKEKRERKPKEKRERPQKEKRPRRERKPKEPRKNADRKTSDRTESRGKRSGLVAVRMALIAAIPAALIFAMLHMQDYLVLSTVEAAGIAFFAAADILLILYLVGYIKQRKAEKKASAEKEESRATYPAYEGDGEQYVPLYAKRAENDSVGTLIPDDRSLPPIPLAGREILVGKQKSLVDVVIPANAVSNIHARIFWKGGVYCVSDMGSKYGTTVDGRALSGRDEIPITEGTKVSFGGCGYTFRR